MWFLSRKYLAREYEVLGFVFGLLFFFRSSSIIVFLTADTQTRKGHTSAASCNCSVSSDSCNNRAMAWRNTSAELVTKQPPGPTFAEQVRPWPRGRQGGRKGAGVIYPRCVIKWDLSIIGTIDPSGDCLLLRPVSPHYSCLGVVRWLLC